MRVFLSEVDPNRRWEVINAGGISYASYRVAELMEELADYEPDLFIVYSGHNEFLEKRTYDKLLKTPEIVRNMAALASRLRLYSTLYDVAYPEPKRKQSDLLPTELKTLLDRYDLSSLRMVASSGSALPGELALRWMDQFGDNLYNFYGSTEVSVTTDDIAM